jgi:hypothetical protein
MADDQLLQQALKKKPETADTLGTLISGAADKATPIDSDSLGLSDSAAGGVLKKLTWANVKATLESYFDTLYPSGSGTSSGANTGDISIGTANGLSLVGQVLSMAAREAVIAAGTTAQFWRGDKSWQTLQASALSDFSSGSFTPGVTFGGGNTGITTFSSVGTWVKLGKQVNFNICTILTAKGTSTGAMLVTGLPVAGAAAFAAQAVSVRLNNLTSGVGDTMLQASIGAAATSISFGKIVAGVHTVLTDADFTNSSSIVISGSYTT